MLTKLLYLNILTNGILPTDDIPDPKVNAPDEMKTKVNLLLGFGMYVVMAACVAGVLIVAGRMAVLHKRGEMGEHFGGLVAVGAACILGAGAAAFVRFVWM